MKTIKFLIIILVLIGPLMYHSDQFLFAKSMLKENSTDTNSLPKQTTDYVNKTLKNSIESPSTLTAITTQYLSNNAIQDIIEVHTNTIYFRFGTNYSIYQIYNGSFRKLNYFPIQYQHHGYGLIIEYNKIDSFSMDGRPNDNRFYRISLINSKGVKIATGQFTDTINGINIIGGVLLQDTHSTLTGPELLVSYIEEVKYQDIYEKAITQMLLFNFNNLDLINDTKLNNAFYLNDNYYYNSSPSFNIIPSIQTNITSNITKVDLFSNYNFSTPIYTSNWYQGTSVKIKAINNYENKSFLLIKIASDANNLLSFLTFQNNFSTLLTNQISDFDPDLGNSNIIIRSLLNNT